MALPCEFESRHPHYKEAPRSGCLFVVENRELNKCEFDEALCEFDEAFRCGHKSGLPPKSPKIGGLQAKISGSKSPRMGDLGGRSR